MTMHNQNHNPINLILALVLSAIVLFGWYYFYEMPRIDTIRKEQLLQERTEATNNPAAILPNTANTAKFKEMPRTEALEAAPRVKISSTHLHGSFSLRGARFDDLTLADYHETTDKNSPEVVLLSPKETNLLYFGNAGWVSSDSSLTLPDENTVWQADGDVIVPGKPLTLSWDNGQGVIFQQVITLDEFYLFTIEQRVINNTGTPVKIASFSMLNRAHTQPNTSAYDMLHEGPLGVANEELFEQGYNALKEEKELTRDWSKGWIGIGDKYWLTAFLPEQGKNYKSRFQFYTADGQDRYQADVLGPIETIAPGETSTTTSHFFAGAKKVKLLDQYGEQLNVPLFDRAVDFGSLYFLTKPLFELLLTLYGLVGNFGIAIILLTLTVRLCLFPLANKSYKSMAQMRLLMPKMQEIRERYEDDKLKMNQEIMALYKKEKVNPASGCLPLLIQLPVFFALYKVLMVTLEMRHAPFFGWIVDLSSRDPSNLFTLFGLIPWDPPGFLHLGVWPIIMTVTTIAQQKLNPKPADPVQAQVMAWMPYIFLVLFANFPAGLVVYWTFNNFFSVIQQWAITRKFDRSGRSKKKKEAASAA